MGGERTVVYVQPARDVLHAVDGSLERKIRSECEQFLDAWRPSQVFDGTVHRDLKKLKKDRTVMRGFGAHWSSSDWDILLVIAIYKKRDETAYYGKVEEFTKAIDDYLETLDDAEEQEGVEEWLQRAEESDQFEVVRG